MNKCKTCRFWNIPRSQPSGVMETLDKSCEHPAIKQPYSWPFNNEVINMGDGYPTTGPNFGCVHWSQK